jgi:predicted transglutaminase-like cysteine proteinase
MVAVAAITAMSATLQQDADLAFPAFRVQPIAFTSLQQLRTDDYLPPATTFEASRWPIAYQYTPLLQKYLDPSDLAFLASLIAAKPATEPLQQVAVGQPEQHVAPAPERRADLAPEHRASLAPSRHVPPARQLMAPIVRIQFNAPTLAPMAHTFFCLKYRDDCKVHKIVFRGGAMALTAKRWAELKRVNAAVNRSIASEPNTKGLAAEKWLISPRSGECHDYAVTKRHELLALGWQERDLLLSEVATSWGEHHLVLVVRTSDGDFVADNLNPSIRSWSKTPYQWVRIQSPTNPKIWSTMASTTVWAKSSGIASHES